MLRGENGGEGAFTGTANLPFPQAPEQDGNSSYNYTIDEDSNKIIIKNYKEVDAGSQFTMSIVYQYDYKATDNGNNAYPQYSYDEGVLNLLSGYKNEISAIINIENDIAVKQMCSLQVHTNNVIRTKTISIPNSSTNIFDTYMDAYWGDKFKPNNPENYIYQSFYSDVSADSLSQNAYVSFNIDIDNEFITPIGYVIENGYSGERPLQFANNESFVLTNGMSLNSFSDSYDGLRIHYVIAVDKQALQDAKTLNGEISASLVIRNMDDNAEIAISGKRSIKYIYPEDNQEGYVFSLSKSSHNNYTHKAHSYLLSNGLSTETRWGTEYSFGNAAATKEAIDNGDAKQHTIEIIDNTLVTSNELLTNSSSNPRKLSKGDYSFSRIYFVNDIDFRYAVPDFSSGKMRYVDTTIPDGTTASLFVQTEENDNWHEVGSFTATSGTSSLGEFIPNELGNSLKIQPYNKVNVDLSQSDNILGIKVSITTTASINLPSYGGKETGVSVRLNPSEALIGFINDNENTKKYLYNINTLAVYDENSSLIGYSNEQSTSKITQKLKGIVEDTDIKDYGTLMYHGSTYMRFTDHSVSATGNKGRQSFKNYDKEQFVEIRYQIFPYLDTLPYLEQYEVTDDMLEILYEHNMLPSKAYYVYDLLPRGAYLIEDSIDENLSIINIENNCEPPPLIFSGGFFGFTYQSAVNESARH